MDSQRLDDRRRAPRHRVTFRVVYDHDGDYCLGTVVDVSATGLRLRVDDPVPLGAEVSIVPVGTAGELLFDVPAFVVRVIERSGDGCDLGLEFTRLDANRLQALQQIFASMPETDEGSVVVGRGKPPIVPPDEPKESSHHRIRARLRGGVDRPPRWARKTL